MNGSNREALHSSFKGNTTNGDTTPRTAAPTPEEAEIDRLAELSPIKYDRERKDAAKRLGCRTTTLDYEISLRRGVTDGPKLQGQELILSEPEPWPEPINGAALLDELAAVFRRFIVLPDSSPEALALWTVFTHAHDSFQVSPRLAITSPVKRCGKTTLLSILGVLVPRPLSASNVTAAVVFRVVEAARPTLLVDEADTFMDGRDELRGILNSGHTRAAAFVVRCVGDDSEPRRFATWTPVAVARVGRLPDTLADRSIAIPMRRRSSGEHVERLRLDRIGDELRDLGRKCTRWAADHVLVSSDPQTPEALHDRARDNWRPLLAIADAIGEDWPARARNAALILSGIPDEDAEPARVQLLADVRDIFASRGLDRIASANLCESLAGLGDRPWSEWRRGKDITPVQLARLLTPFGVRSKTIRLGSETAKGYELTAFEDAFARYLPPQSVTPSQDAQRAVSGEFGAVFDNLPKRNAVDSVTDEESASTGTTGVPNPDCDVVTDRSTWKGTGTRRGERLRQCGTHAEQRFWKSAEGRPICAICHPPPDPTLVVEWIEGNGEY